MAPPLRAPWQAPNRTHAGRNLRTQLELGGRAPPRVNTAMWLKTPSEMLPRSREPCERERPQRGKVCWIQI